MIFWFQILHAAGTSSKGKVVKLADKLYNVRDLELGLPEGWTEERRCEYFEWAYQVCEGLRGVSRPLEQKLGQIFEAKGLVSYLEVPRGIVLSVFILFSNTYIYQEWIRLNESPLL